MYIYTRNDSGRNIFFKMTNFKSVGLILIFGATLSFAEVQDNHQFCSSLGEPDYYWRQYTGKIPYDALPVVDEYGEVLYIGQVLYPLTKALVPANIFPENGTAFTSAGGEIIYYEIYPKILCTRNRSRFRWIPVSVGNLNLVKFHLVVGGTENDKIVYIGRGHHEGKLLVGKVYLNSSPYKGLWLPSQGGGENLLSFEILVYDIY